MKCMPQPTGHPFEGVSLGTPDRACTKCELPDRHPVHIPTGQSKEPCRICGREKPWHRRLDRQDWLKATQALSSAKASGNNTEPLPDYVTSAQFEPQPNTELQHLDTAPPALIYVGIADRLAELGGADE